MMRRNDINSNTPAEVEVEAEPLVNVDPRVGDEEETEVPAGDENGLLLPPPYYKN